MRSSLLLAAVLALPLVGCRPPEEDCRHLLDHFLDVESAAATEGRFREMSDPMKAALEDQKGEFRRSIGPRFTTECRAQLSRAEVACALAATDEASMDHCEGH